MPANTTALLRRRDSHIPDDLQKMCPQLLFFLLTPDVTRIPKANSEIPLNEKILFQLSNN